MAARATALAMGHDFLEVRFAAAAYRRLMPMEQPEHDLRVIVLLGVVPWATIAAAADAQCLMKLSRLQKGNSR